MLSLSDHQLARDLADHRAIIIKSDRADAYPAYAYGDRRKRPLRWVSDESFRALTSFGGLKSGPRGFCVTESFCLLYTSPSPRDATLSRMPSSA